MARSAAIIGSFLLLLGAGCGPAPREARVAFEGRPSYGLPYADTRRAVEVCPVCSAPFGKDGSACEGVRSGGERCGVRLKHPASAPCGFCAETGACAACAVFETSGRCRHCLGSGRLGDQPCFNCGGEGRCVACGGGAACDACGGRRTVAIPWSPKAPSPSPVAPGAAVFASPKPAVASPGEAVTWRGASEWALFVVEDGRRQEIDRIAGDPARLVVRRAGFFRAVAPGGAAVFDVIEVRLPPGLLPGTPLPDLRIEPAPRSHAARWAGDLDKDPAVVVEIPGLPPFRVPVPVVQRVDSIRVLPAALPARAGSAAAFQAESRPPLGPNALVEWTVTGAGRTDKIQARGPAFEYSFLGAGLYTVQAAAGGASSPPVEVPVYRVDVVDDLGRPVTEARMVSPRPEAFHEGRLREEALLASPERLRVRVEDPAGGAPGLVRIATRSPEDGLVQGPVELALSGSPDRRVTRAFVVLPDRDDAGREAIPEDATIQGVARGRIEVHYRGLSAGGVPVGPMILHEIPLRVSACGPGLPSGDALVRALEFRVAQANAIWEPLGRRFRLASVTRFESTGNLLLIRGRAAGVEATGRPSRAGARVDGKDWAAPTPWREGSGPVTPATAARALQARTEAIGAGTRADLFEKLFGGDPEAVLLRVLRPDGRPVVLAPLGGEGDVAQSCRPLPLDLSDGCEVAAGAGRLSLEEAAVIVGAKEGGLEGLDLFLVSELRSLAARPAYKVYPGGLGLPPAVAGSALLGLKAMDSSDRYPYVLARVLGELLMPAGLAPGPEDTLFRDPLSETAGVGANKRISAGTARKILERGRANPGPN